MRVDDRASDVLHAFRSDVENMFPGRVRRFVLYGSRARGDETEDSDWDVAIFIDDFNRSLESRPLNFLSAAYARRNRMMISPVGLPSDRSGVSPELLWHIDHDGVAV